MRLLIRSVLAAVLLLLAYHTWLLFNPGEVAVPQGINQDNVIKMQEYIYAPASQYSTVILGSSLAAKLRSQALPPTVYNLALRGQSAFEGFEILKRSGQHPRLILVELDVLDREPNRSTIENLFNPTLHPLRSLVPAFQERHQPLNQLLTLGFTGLERLRPESAGHIREKLGVRAAGTTPPDPFATQEQPEDLSLNPKVVAQNRLEGNQLPMEPGFGANMALLKRYARYFTKQGSHVVFFQMPVDAGVCEGAKMQYIRRRVEAICPPGAYTFLPAPDCSQYYTTDGLHLTDASALRFSQQLAQQLQQLPLQPH